jgi:actin-related protein
MTSSGVAMPAERKQIGISLGKELVRAGEYMFSPQQFLHDYDPSLVGLPTLVAEVVQTCEMDTRRGLISNVILSGGGSKLAGLRERLERELAACMPYAKAHVSVVADDDRQWKVWQGASLLAASPGYDDELIWKDEVDADGGIE